MALILAADFQDNAASATVVSSVGPDGTLKDGAANRNTSLSSVAGPGGQWPLALSMDGANDRVDFPAIAANGNAAGLFVVVQSQAAQAAFAGVALSRGVGAEIFGMHISDAGGQELGFTWDGSHFDFNSGIHLPLNEFCGVALSVAPTQAALYIFKLDGTVLRATRTAAMAAINFLQGLDVGNDTVAGGRAFSGDFCGLRVYNHSPTESEFQAVWNEWIPALIAASVPADGDRVDLTFAASPASLPTTVLTVEQDGIPVAVGSASGAGTSRTAHLGVRWLRSGATVNVTAGNDAAAAVNNSVITERMVRYVGRGFGMFLHFSINTFNNVDISSGNLSADTFAPTEPIEDCIDQWIAVAKSAGMRYLALTAKHWDGFCLWPTATTTYNLTQSSWYAGAGSPDVVKLFTQKVRAAGLGCCLYHCINDMTFETANPGATDEQYAAYFHAQLTELLGNYGPLDMVWLDGWSWVGSLIVPMFADIPFAPVRALFDQYQPQCAITVNSHEHTLANTDVSTWEVPFEGGVPADNVLPAEAADTIRGDNFWFWHTAAENPKSAATILSNLSTYNGRRAAYLLNVPPDTTGKIADKYARVLADVGAARFEELPPPNVRGYSRGRIVNP